MEVIFDQKRTDQTAQSRTFGPSWKQSPRAGERRCLSFDLFTHMNTEQSLPSLVSKPRTFHVAKILQCLSKPLIFDVAKVLQCLSKPLIFDMAKVLQCLSKPRTFDVAKVLQFLSKPQTFDVAKVLRFLSKPQTFDVAKALQFLGHDAVCAWCLPCSDLVEYLKVQFLHTPLLMAGWQGADYSSEIEAAIINNQPDVLENVLSKADINMCLNNQRDSPLFLAVKLSHRDIVNILLSSPGCNLAHQNINHYSPLDLALVMVFNNQKEPRQSACWEILELLLEAGAESACPDAMLYVIRTALKLNDDQFIFHLIHTLTVCCKSLDLHALLLRKLHRHQPMYTGVSSDLFFEQASNFSVKLIKLYTSRESLQQIVECFPYYADSHWDVREGRNSLFIKLIIYLTVAGWQWTNQADLQYMSLICTNLSQWCYQMLRTVPSLTHLCRVSLTSSPSARQFIIPSRIPNILLSYLDYKDIDSLAPFTSAFDFSLVQL